MRNLLMLFCVLLPWPWAMAQPAAPLTIEACYTSATENYPLIRQRELILKTEEYSVSNAAKGIFPVVTVNGQQSYQSDVTQVPVRIPDMNIPTISKNQYKIYGDIVLNLYDGGTIRNQKQSHEATARVEERKLAVELYKIKDRVNQLYFGVLLLDAQDAQNELVKNDIRLGIRKAEAAIANGTALKSSADALEAELLKLGQRTIELTAMRAAYLDALGLLIGQRLDQYTVLVKPAALPASAEIRRPELQVFEYQYKTIDVQERMLRTRNLPRLAGFLQVGYGRPALNMLDNTPDSYYIAGLRLNWTLSGFYTLRKEKALLDMSRRNIDLQKETFVFNTNLAMKQQRGEVSKLQQLLASDDAIITLRSKVKNTASAQLENGVISTNDYLREVSAEDQARQNKILHETQWLMAQYTLQTTAGI